MDCPNACSVCWHTREHPLTASTSLSSYLLRCFASALQAHRQTTGQQAVHHQVPATTHLMVQLHSGPCRADLLLLFLQLLLLPPGHSREVLLLGCLLCS